MKSNALCNITPIHQTNLIKFGTFLLYPFALTILEVHGILILSYSADYVVNLLLCQPALKLAIRLYDADAHKQETVHKQNRYKIIAHDSKSNKYFMNIRILQLVFAPISQGQLKLSYKYQNQNIQIREHTQYYRFR